MKRSFHAALSFALLAASAVHAQELKLPDPLVAKDGDRVDTAEEWVQKRRPEILELFREHIYGRAPIGRPEGLKFEVFDFANDAMEGKATRKQVNITFRGPGGEGAIKLVLFIPNNRPKPVPCMLLICNRPPTNTDPTRATKSPFWPAEEIVARGYAAAAFHNADVVPDKHDGFKSGVFAIFDSAPRAKDAWGAIAAWAWGASRVMDYLETDSAIDAKRVAVVGHSRGGKTALWAGAEDTRFAMVVSNDSGSTGAAIARQKTGESIERINKSFPHWFNENYKAYAGREDDLPVDQHMLAALTAPRLLYIASASEDSWAHPRNEFLAAVHASPVFELLGKKGIGSTEFPAPDSPIHQGRIGYHLRSGKHNLTDYDWQQFMNFADQHLHPKAPPAE